MPLTGERAQYELSREEKLALYDHVRQVAKTTNPSNMISDEELLLLQDKGGLRHIKKVANVLSRCHIKRRIGA